MPAESSDPLVIYTVYDRPTDFPDKWVVRKFLAGEKTNEHWTYDHLNAARAPMVRMGLTRFPAHPTDDPVIYETWF
jgi:hypothetical protein